MTAGHREQQAEHEEGSGAGGAEDATTTPATESASESSVITVIGFGSLLSEKSSRMTFPDLQNFRLATVPNYRRVFCHPTTLFFQRGIANFETLEMASLSVEYHEGSSFVAAVFEVPNKDMMNDGVPSPAFLKREEEYNITTVPYTPLLANDDFDGTVETTTTSFKGIICERSSDKAYLERWGEERFEKEYKRHGVDTIWGWKEDSGIRPCAVYLRHCYLAAKALGDTCFDSFLDETFLVDRVTTIRQYMEENPAVLDAVPPPELAVRYCGE